VVFFIAAGIAAVGQKNRFYITGEKNSSLVFIHLFYGTRGAAATTGCSPPSGIRDGAVVAISGLGSAVLLRLVFCQKTHWAPIGVYATHATVFQYLGAFCIVLRFHFSQYFRLCCTESFCATQFFQDF
jgi:hypothetical protein